MKQAIAKKWVKALRSGEYQQGQGQLRDGDQFCCLGVLCNLHAQSHKAFARTQKFPDEYDREAAYPSEMVRKWAGIDTYNGWIPNLDQSLAAFNDEGFDFNEIADLIEKHWKEL